MIIISVGGSLISPTDHSRKTIGTIDLNFVRAFRNLILKRVRSRERFIIVTGGGGPSRAYAHTALELNPKAKEVDRHWIGIAATKLNAEFFRVLFSPLSHASILGDPMVSEKFKKPIAIGAGWKPGHSTDMDAVVYGKTYGARMIVNLTNVDHIYSDDPRKNKRAVAFDHLSWKEYKKVLGMKTFKPSAHAPFDPVASAFAQKHRLTVTIADGGNLSNVENLLKGREFVGTTISP